MKLRKRNAFTLIELVAVLVIMAIIALIVTPLVMSIIRKARIFADKRSIDAYGRSIELAIAGYLMNNGSFPTSIEELTIEYSGDEIVCTTTQLNSDSSIYLAGCTVGGRSVEGYTYGKEETTPTPTGTAYQVGDEVTYNNINYYVIKDSDTSEDSVTLLKAEPLTAEEITSYSVGTGAQTDGNGGMQYHSESNVYATSYVKQTIDAWKIANALQATEARLIQYDEIEIESREYKPCGDSCGVVEVGEYAKYDWLYNNNYWYWTMIQDTGSGSVLIIKNDGLINGAAVGSYTGSYGVVRPVIVLPKSALSA